MKKLQYPLVSVRWLDAHYQEGEHEIEKLDGKCELFYVGWLAKEDENSIVLSLEQPHDGRTRNPFTILKRNIIEMKRVALRSIERRKKNDSDVGVADTGDVCADRLDEGK